MKNSLQKEIDNKQEIIEACKSLYKDLSFKEITIKVIGENTHFSRTSIYNYFETKEEIFLAILKQEYEAWVNDLLAIEKGFEKLSVEQFANLIASSLDSRKLLLKIMSMNLYDMEANSRVENLIEFKESYGKSLKEMDNLLIKFFPFFSKEERFNFTYSFFPFIYGIYPYTSVTPKQIEAMNKANVNFPAIDVKEITYMCLINLLGDKR